MFVSWFDSPLVAWNPMFELNEVCFEMCWGYMGHDGPFFCLSVFSPWHPRVLIGGRAHVFVGPRDSRDSRQGTEESTRNAECPWDLVSKSCFPRNVHLNVLMFVVPAMISLIETSGPIYMLHYVAVFSVRLEYREAPPGSEMLNEWSTWMIFTQQSWSPWSTYPLVN